MAVESIHVRRCQPFDYEYERVDAIVHYAIDPADAVNQGIVDVDLALRGSDGLVRMEGDLTIFRPSDRARSNGSLLAWVTNRGRVPVVPFSVPPATMSLDVRDPIEPGNSFLLRRGWSIALLGWQWDVMRRPGMIGLQAPLAEGAESEITLTFTPNRDHSTERLAHMPWNPDQSRFDDRHVRHHVYPPADRNDPRAVLTCDGAEVPRSRWSFSGDGTSAQLDGAGFERGRRYSLRYRTARCPVVGAGLLAVRDTVAHLKHDPSRIAGNVDHAVAVGVSQTGRFLREYLGLGLSADELGHGALDGVMVQVAGARRGEFNCRGGQPSAMYTDAAVRPPYGYAALVPRWQERAHAPKVFHIDTSNEYWRSSAYEVHGEGDLVPPNVRCYLLAGHQHFPGFPLLTDRLPMSPEVRSARPLNTLNPGALLRAALINLDAWVRDGTAPPPTAVPSFANGTAVRASSLAGHPEVVAGDTVVSAVDESGNEIAGIRHPEIEVPIARHLGWNLRAPAIGAEGELLDMSGTTIAEPSLRNRWADRGAYEGAIEKAAEALVDQRWMLPEDVAFSADLAGRFFDSWS